MVCKEGQWLANRNTEYRPVNMHFGRMVFTDEQHISQLVIAKTNAVDTSSLFTAWQRALAEEGCHFYLLIAMGFYCPGDPSARNSSISNSVIYTGKLLRAGAEVTSSKSENVIFTVVK